MDAGTRRTDQTVTDRVPRRLARRARSNVQRLGRRTCRSFGVLVYHRIGAQTVDPWHLAVTPEHFDEHLRALRRLGTIVPLDREAARSAVTRLGARRRRFAVTFDDGYVDNLRAAVPVLERHDAPATIFVATGFLDRPSFWWDRLAAVVLSGTSRIEPLVTAATGLGLMDFGGGQLADRTALHEDLWHQLVGRPPAEIDALLDAIQAAVGGVAEVDGRPMTTDELIELARHPLVSIGAHTVDHRRLTWLDERTVFDQMVDGNAQLDALVGPARRPFAYPFGEAGRRTARTARRAGFGCALTTRPDWVSLFDGPRLLPRLHPVDTSGAELARWLDGS